MSTSKSQELRFAILGPLELRRAGDLLRLPGPGLRALLALLLLRHNQIVPASQLIDELWSDRPPSEPRTTLQTYVLRWRQILGKEALLTRSLGYLVPIESPQLDLAVFEQLLTAARQVLATLSEANDTLGSEPAGSHYLTVYYSDGNADRSVELLDSNQPLAEYTAHALQTFQPALQAVLDGTGSTVTVTQAMIDELNSLLDAFATADLAAGGGALAGTIAHERSLVDLNALVGLTADQARVVLNQQFPAVTGGG